MIKTTREELGDAYNKASEIIIAMDPETPKIMGHYWRERFGLHHRYEEPWIGEPVYWIEFPLDEDYTYFMLRFS